VTGGLRRGKQSKIKNLKGSREQRGGKIQVFAVGRSFLSSRGERERRTLWKKGKVERILKVSRIPEKPIRLVEMSLSLGKGKREHHT